MTDCLNASELRRWAEQCFAQASNARVSGEERERLLKMHTSLLVLAENADWLAGKQADGPALKLVG
jgi:hypothetical protein